MTTETQIPVSGALGDYLEAIYVLSENSPYVRITDISVYLNISKPSVNRAVNTLKNQGYVTHKPYSDICLTEQGREAGAAICCRLDAVKQFLMSALGISEECAGREARHIERGISQSTIDRMADFMKSEYA